MTGTTSILLYVIVISIGLVAILVARPGITATKGGKILAFVAFLIFPILSGGMGVSLHLEHSKSTEFCTSCHIMQDYGLSLRIDDRSYIPAVHYQNNLVPREQACYTCHTDYAMYGDFRAKIRGMKHVYAQYLGTAAQPVKLYTPYNNRECLHCHKGSRSFEEGATHNMDLETLPKVKANELGCTSTGCHEMVHNVQGLKDATFWNPNVKAKEDIKP
jgi:cytochrome c-type protein NapC